MVSSILKQAKGILRKQKRDKRRQRGFLCLAAVVVVATIAMLMATGQALTRQAEALDCQLELHEHVKACYDQEDNLLCGYADYVIHVHNDDCYDSKGNRICTLDETEPHEHTEECYTGQKVLACELAEAAGAEGHTHTEKCYAVERGGLLCGTEEHSHVEACYESALTCGQEAHVHGAACQSEDGGLLCGTEEHSHGEGCYTDSLSCGQNEHVHTDGCYDTKKVLNCTEKESEGTAGHSHTDACYKDEKVLSCGKLELHTHAEALVEDGGCYGEEAFDGETGEFIEGSLPVCGLLQLEEHVHEEGCLGGQEDSAEAGATPSEETLEADLFQKEFIGEYAGGTLKVTAAYGKEAGIPEEAELVVEAITEETDEASYKEKTDAAKELAGYRTASAELLCDIGFFVDGEEIEPSGTVTIEFQFYQDGMEAGEKVTVIHFGEDEPRVLESTDMLQKEDGSLSTSFDSDCFSPFMLIVGGEDVRFAGFVSKEGQVYKQADSESDVYKLSGYEPALEEALRIEVLDTVTDAQGEEWYEYAAVTEDEALSEVLSGYPYIPAKDVALGGKYTRQTLTAVDDEGVAVTVEGLLPEGAKLSANRIYDPEIADVKNTMSYNTDGGVDFGDFRLVYNIGLGTEQKLLEPVAVTVSNFDFSYDNYSNLSAWAYSITPSQEAGFPAVVFAEEEREKVTAVSADEEGEEVTEVSSEEEGEEAAAASVDAEIKKIDARMEEDGRITFRTERLSTLYIGSALLEGHDEYFNSLAEPEDILQWEDIREIVEAGEETEGTEEAAEGAEEITAPVRSRLKSRMAVQIPTTSEGQIVGKGGTVNSNPASDGVTASKTIAATNMENVFDITLQVKAPEVVFDKVTVDPDVAVVLVMDVSNTMTYGFNSNAEPGTGDKARKSVAISAGKKLINEFYKDFGQYGNSRIGMVTFNTNARQTFGMQTCKNTEKRETLKENLENGINGIFNADYAGSDKRFTNIEAGLKKAYDMLSDAGITNKNKYVILVTDGFPTTYINKSSDAGEYIGYAPITSGAYTGSKADGVFSDRVRGKNCLYGCNYSDKGAKKAKDIATKIKNNGIKIYSVGVALGAQSVQGFINDCKNSDFATVDITSSDYAVGSTAAEYKDWLKNNIGSGYYGNGATADGFTKAFDDIVEKIVKYHTKTAQTVMTVADPIPADLEFIGFYNNCNSTTASALQAQTANLAGSHASKGENTAAISSGSISWNLQKSGFTSSAVSTTASSTSTTGTKTTTTYTYTLKYRVRLKNEAGSFDKSKTYSTNGTTTLTYKTSTTTKVDNKETTANSENKTMNLKIPSVRGYLSELEFKKIDLKNEIVAGAEFTLTHDTANCKACRGNSTSVPNTVLKPFKAVSDADGRVSFVKVPSGHQYILKETKVPEGYYSFGETYQVKVAYNTQVITKVNADKTKETVEPLDWVVENGNVYSLPETGGPGVSGHIGAGTALTLLAAAFCFGYLRRKSMRGDE